MNAPQVWIFFPAILALLLMVFQRWWKVGALVAATFTLGLAGFAYLVPIGEKYKLLFWNIEISDSLSVLGRRLILSSDDRTILILIYVSVSFWIIGALVSASNRLFTPLSIGVSVLLIAALAIEPFLYAAIILEMMVLVCVILLIKPGKASNRGVIRLLTFQTLAMPFILFTGWLLTGVEVNPEDSSLVSQAAILMAIGFGLLFSIFPFHSWIPLLAEEADPISVSFVFFILPLVIGLLGISFIDRFSWLYTTSWLYVYLRFSGVLMVIFGSVWSIFQRNLARLMGFAVIIEIGYSLLTISLGLGPIQNRPLMGLFFTSLLPRGISYGLWALSLSVILKDRKLLDYHAIRGVAYQYPFVVVGITMAVLSLIGFPLTAGYTNHSGLWQYLNEQFPLAAQIVIIGSVGLTFGLFRSLIYMFQTREAKAWEVHEKTGERILIGLACASLVIFGLLPQLYTSALINMGLSFLNITP